MAQPSLGALVRSEARQVLRSPPAPFVLNLASAGVLGADTGATGATGARCEKSAMLCCAAERSYNGTVPSNRAGKLACCYMPSARRTLLCSEKAFSKMMHRRATKM